MMLVIDCWLSTYSPDRRRDATDGRYPAIGCLCDNMMIQLEFRPSTHHAGPATADSRLFMFRRFLSAALIAAVSVSAAAADDADKVARDTFKKISPNGKVTSVTKSEVPGFHQVLVGSTVYFISDDGKYFINGNIYDVDAKRDVGAAQIAAVRKEALAKIPVSKELLFAPKNPKYTVTVFTDVDCPYCRQFHKQIDEYNKLGIAVKYVFYPLPIHPGADKKAETVWCSANRNAAYTTAMNGSWDVAKPAPKTTSRSARPLPTRCSRSRSPPLRPPRPRRPRPASTRS
jgi:thiol:disulfide interchange protein DsbC